MGTNFYTDTEERLHIGKRSAAGLYCWDCGVTLCMGGEKAIHYDTHGWHDACPKCGNKPSERESLQDGSVGRELGFNKSAPMRKTGVVSCSSFAWAMEPDQLEGYSQVVDEYGTHYTMMEFFQVLEECPVRDFEFVGREFS
jgi:hypothetical protein